MPPALSFSPPPLSAFSTEENSSFLLPFLNLRAVYLLACALCSFGIAAQLRCRWLDCSSSSSRAILTIHHLPHPRRDDRSTRTARRKAVCLSMQLALVVMVVVVLLVVVVVVFLVMLLVLLVLLCQWLAPRATIVEAWAARHYAATSVFK
jgi:hypothetical protein